MKTAALIGAIAALLPSFHAAGAEDMASWMALHKKEVGWLGTNPANRTGLMIEIDFSDGARRFPVVWDADNAGPEVLKGCNLERGSRGSACRAQVVVSVAQGQDVVVIVEHLIALEK